VQKLNSPEIIIIIIIIQLNSILYFLCAESSATRPITDTAQNRNIIIIKVITIIKYNNSRQKMKAIRSNSNNNKDNKHNKYIHK
jgi:hypothetical protein